MNIKVLQLVIIIFISSFHVFADIILDNTADGTASLSASLGSITQNNFQAKVFTTPSSGIWTLDVLKMSLYNTSGSYSSSITIELTEVDGSLNPSGLAIVSENFYVELTTTPEYYDFDLNNSLWELSESYTYALVFSASAAGTTSWTKTDNAYTTSNGFTFDATRRSTDGGSSWSENSYTNGLQIIAVPEPATSGMLFFGLGISLGVHHLRRRMSH
ncbi:MAG: PEP-CTERM sorting domain-containing protein [Kiritimatiellales bacterium]